MKNLKIYIFLIAFFVLCGNYGSAETHKSNENSYELPDWAKRVDLGIDAGTDIKSRIYFETVQPLYQDEDKQHTIFIQPRCSVESKDGVYNLGMGYRRLLNNNAILLGANTFFDYEDDDKHYRIGFGSEAFINQIELRANSYIGLSPRRLIVETATRKEYEKAVDGFDAEIGLPIPYMNWIKLYGAGYWYNYEEFKNKEGWRIRSEIKPFNYITINLIVWDDNKGNSEFRADARICLPIWAHVTKYGKCNLGFSDEAYPEKIDHANRTLDRVEREYRIEVERWLETTGAVVEIKRGN
jgi:adhesin/invasin